MPEQNLFAAEAAALHEHLVTVRRELHEHPEIGLDLPRTQSVLLRELDGLGLEISVGQALSSVTAVLRGARPGPTVLLRADMDGLPIAEATGLPFAASNGTMHACGHDLHMAGLLGAARVLAARREELAGQIVFMFQPGEEGYAGGRIMVEEGVLDVTGERPVAAYAVHVECTAEPGKLITRPGPIMGSVSAMRLSLRGTGGHAAFPHVGVDPVPVAAELVLAVQSFAARRVPATDPAVISVTSLQTDSNAGNVLAAKVDIVLNIRTLSRATLDIVREKLPELLEGIARAHGATLEYEFIPSYPVTFNDPVETERAIAVLESRTDAGEIVRLPAPSMASEDFAYVLEEVPGTLVFLGVAPEGGSTGMHSETAVFDDGLLGLQASLLAELAWRRLHE